MSAFLLGLEFETVLLLGLVGAAAVTVVAYQNEQQQERKSRTQQQGPKRDRHDNPRAHLDESEVLFKDHRRDNIRNVSWDWNVL